MLVAPKCQMEFARNVESDGQYFGENAGENWALAHKEWTEEFGAFTLFEQLSATTTTRSSRSFSTTTPDSPKS